MNKIISVLKALDTEKPLKFMHIAVSASCALLLLILTAVSLFRTTDMNMDNSWLENIEYIKDNIFVNLCALACFFLLFYIIRLYADKINLKYIKIALVSWVIIMGLIWVLSVKSAPTQDSSIVINAAGEFLKGDYGRMNSAYLQNFPYQLGYIFFSEFLMRILRFKNVFLTLQAVNVICLAVSYISILDIVKITLKKNTVYIFSAFLLMMCFQPVLFTTFLYGNLPAFMFAALAVRFSLKYFENNLKRDALLSALFIGISSIIKLNSLIVAVALCAMFFLHFLKTKKLLNFAFIALILISGAMLNTLTIKQYEWRSGEKMGEGVPMVSWLAMGVNEAVVSPGWFNAMYATGTYEAAGMDAAKASEESVRIIKERLKVFSEDPKYAASFFYEKFASQWNEPTYQSIWTNQVRSHYAEPNRLGNYICGDGEKTFKIYMGFYQQFIFLCCLMGLAVCLKRGNYTYLILPVIILGGFLYHMLFEAKSQYMLTYFVLMIPIAALGLDSFLDKTEICVPKVKKYILRRRS
ncbi:MAG: glycosyltransferase family 39 protein [Oscillospiraceae bacterium]|nr:glycosyltransferase family 39 protein [Oscillospiraceae bacterium]